MRFSGLMVASLLFADDVVLVSSALIVWSRAEVGKIRPGGHVALLTI